jgi:uncharacterized protein with von Willebrand factor type A (vWA) domain
VSAPAVDEPGLLQATLRLCRALRQRGVGTTPGDAVEAVRALERLDLSDRREVYVGLRAVVVRRVEDYPLYDELFELLWRPPIVPAAGGPRSIPGGTPLEREGEPATGRRSAAVLALERWLPAGERPTEPVGVPAFGAEPALARKDFATFTGSELEEVSRVAALLARRLARRPGRRWRPVPRGSRVHPRRTLRRAMRTGGELVELAYRVRKEKKSRLVVLCDVSGSMDLYARLLLQFLFALQHRFSRVETFVFSTRLSRVTDQLRTDRYSGALDRLAREVHDWSGGTRIGASLASFNAGWPRLVDPRTVVIILSDGWDTGPPEELSREMKRLGRRARRVIWLNPLLGTPGYQPLTRGMQAALPHVDVFAPAHDLASLQALARHLVA